MREGKYVLTNGLSLAEEGPWTRVDPALGVLSCLDLTRISLSLLPYIKGFVIDDKQELTPKRVERRRGTFGFTYTDNYSHELVLVLPSNRIKCMKENGWNTFNPGAWEAYKEVTKRNASNIEKIVNNIELTEEEVMKKVDKIEGKIKKETVW